MGSVSRLEVDALFLWIIRSAAMDDKGNLMLEAFLRLRKILYGRSGF